MILRTDKENGIVRFSMITWQARMRSLHGKCWKDWNFLIFINEEDRGIAVGTILPDLRRFCGVTMRWARRLTRLPCVKWYHPPFPAIVYVLYKPAFSDHCNGQFHKYIVPMKQWFMGLNYIGCLIFLVCNYGPLIFECMNELHLNISWNSLRFCTIVTSLVILIFCLCIFIQAISQSNFRSCSAYTISTARNRRSPSDESDCRLTSSC